MCYSILVETDMKRLGLNFDAVWDFDSFVEIYEKRDSGASNLYIPPGIDLNFLHEENSASKKIAKLVKKHNSEIIKKLESKITEKKQIVSDLETKQTKKWFKSDQKKLDTANRVIITTRARIDRMKRPLKHRTPHASRIMQYYYAPVIVKEGRKNTIRPLRYQVRSSTSKNEVDRKINMFNARIESLEDRQTWRPLFMKNHGLISYVGFYEWVLCPKTKKPAEIFFRPKTANPLWSPVLFDHWTNGKESINSFAVLTTTPPRAIEEMGHDRCPIIPESSFQFDWLNPKSCHKEFIYRSLHLKEPVAYDYQWVDS